MAASENLDIPGKSGTKYSFRVYSLGQAFNRVGAAYAILKRERNSEDTAWEYTRVYIGETGTLDTRFYDHHKEKCFKEEGANCIAVHVDSSEESRRAKEQDILNEGVWPCNG